MTGINVWKNYLRLKRMWWVRCGVREGEIADSIGKHWRCRNHCLGLLSTYHELSPSVPCVYSLLSLSLSLSLLIHSSIVMGEWKTGVGLKIPPLHGFIYVDLERAFHPRYAKQRHPPSLMPNQFTYKLSALFEGRVALRMGDCALSSSCTCTHVFGGRNEKSYIFVPLAKSGALRPVKNWPYVWHIFYSCGPWMQSCVRRLVISVFSQWADVNLHPSQTRLSCVKGEHKSRRQT